jgi:uncharacterized DUF497 family protein
VICAKYIVNRVGTEYEGTRFEWDEEKAAANIVNHDDVTFFEAVMVFADPLSVIIDDDEHSIDEQRLLTIGVSNRDRVLIVSYTERDNVIRIISARKAEPKEIRIYEEGE